MESEGISVCFELLTFVIPAFFELSQPQLSALSLASRC